MGCYEVCGVGGRGEREGNCGLCVCVEGISLSLSRSWDIVVCGVKRGGEAGGIL